MADVVIRTLGAPTIEYRGATMKVDTRKAIALLIYLAVEAHPSSRDSLAALLWPEHDQTKARAALRRTLSVLHKALGGEYLAIERERLSLEGPAAPWVDVTEFRRLLATRLTHAHEDREVCAACLEPLQRAVALYHGDFLSGFALRDSSAYDDWQDAHAQTLRDELGQALSALTRCLILVGQLSEAISVARRWLTLDPLNEQTHRFLMRLYDWTGQRAAALRQYAQCAQTLEKELGAQPLAVTTRLFEAIRAHKAPGPPQAQGAYVPEELDPAASDTRAGALAQNRQTEATPLIGRNAEWTAALGAFSASVRQGRLLVIEGEAGIGKTRLADELVAYTRRQGCVVGVARCYQGENTLAYTPMAALLRSALGERPIERLGDASDLWLSEAARLAPELAALRPALSISAPLEASGAQSRFFEGLREILSLACAAGTAPGLLLLDDAQWADDGSLDALAYLLRRLDHSPICVALTWRSDALDARHRLRRLLAEAQRRQRASHLVLRRLDEADVHEWVRHDLGGANGKRASDFAAHLYQETEGLPFFIAQYLMAFSNRSQGMGSAVWEAPVGVQDLLRSRLSVLSETAWQTLTSAAILGRSFDLDTVRVVSGRSEDEVTTAVDELAAHGLIREAPDTRQSEITYDFTHDKLRALVYDETSAARRRLLHRRAADALLAASRRQRLGPERAAQIARHFAAAGDAIAAAQQHMIAGARASELYAHAEAIWHFQQALELGYPDVAAAQTALGDAYTLLADYPRALAAYAEASAIASGSVQARLRHKVGIVYARSGEWSLAQGEFDVAEQALRNEPQNASTEGALARIHSDWSLTARRLGALDSARAHAQEALTLATSAEDVQALAQAQNILGALANSQGDTSAALDHLQASLALAERLHDGPARAAALNNLALALGAAGQHERALRLAEEALKLSHALGDRHHEAALHNNIADLLHARGNHDDAMSHLKQAVTIFAEIGAEAGDLQPGIWMMVDW